MMSGSQNQSNNGMKEAKYIKIKVNMDQYNRIKQKAEEQSLTLQNYLVLKGTDDVNGAEELRNSISKMLPDYYNRIKGVGNAELQQYLRDFGGTLCRL